MKISSRLPVDVESDRAKEIFADASVLDPTEWDQFLGQACAGDSQLKLEVNSLLRAQLAAGDFLIAPGLDEARALTYLLEAGTWIGRYRLVELIGQGGYGSVYLAEQHEPIRRPVAVKIIKLGMDTTQVVARFEAERQALATMDHPNIAKVYEAGATETGRPWFAMELVRGDSIVDFCNANQLGLRERLNLFIPVCQAISHAHQKGIIHRDIKPSNVLVATHDGQNLAKVIDFGIAKAMGAWLTDRTLLTESFACLGTPQYMSPEQAHINGAKVDARSDVYGLGALLYELLAGTPPFDLGSFRNAPPEQVLSAIREIEPVCPSKRIIGMGDVRPVASAKFCREIRGDLDCIVMKCLARDPIERYESVGELIDDIQRYLADQQVRARAMSFRHRLDKSLRRHRASVGVGILIAIGGVVGLSAGIVATRHAAAPGRATATVGIQDHHRTVVQAPERNPNDSVANLRTVDLMPLIDVSRDAVSGHWSRTGKTLIASGSDAVKLQIPYRPPAEYDFVIDFKDTDGDGPVIQMCPTTTGSFMWQVAWDGYGFEGANGLPGGKRPLVERNEVNTVVVRVRNDRVQAFFNGTLTAAFDRADFDFALSSLWTHPDQTVLGLGIWNSTTIFSRIELVETADSKPIAR